MSSHWIVKTEPSTYSFDDLASQKTAVWDGVKNNLALKHLRQMKPGDRVLVYHTGDEKAVVGVAEVVSEAYADPKQKDPKLAVVDLRAVGRLPRQLRQPAPQEEAAQEGGRGEQDGQRGADMRALLLAALALVGAGQATDD